jgi:multiple sugar transport system substrate-binding protein
MLPYYQNFLKLQDSGATVSYSDATTNKLTYQAQFGKQNCAMMLMGSWYIATLVSQQKSGDANQFTWGMVPAPQVDSSTVSDPVTFGDPTGMGINANIDPSKLQAAKDFLTFISSQDAATALAGIGITPAMSSDAVTAAVFAQPGMPTDAESKTAFQTHKTYPENAPGPDQMNISTVLGNAHTAIMSESQDAASALAAAGTTVQNKDW